jgi:hypothetical protein
MMTPPPAGAGDREPGLDALAAQLARIEERLDRLESANAPTPATSPAAASPDTSPASAPTATAASDTSDTPDDDPYWVLTGLEERHPDDDVVLYAGTFPGGDGGGYRWQFGLPTASILDGDFADAAPALSALAHPVRLTLLQAVLAGTHQTAELSALPGIGTSGQVYHHLNQLAAAGWLRSPRRGRWEVPGERTIPLLALLMAATS